MKTVFRGILAIVAGLVVGGCVNMGLVVFGPHVIPPPAGVNVSDAASIRASIHLFEPKHFVFPFFAHALGTLAGAIVASVVAARHRRVYAYVVGVAYLAGGIAAANMIPAPRWFLCLDLGVAYLPMAWLGAWLGCRIRREAGPEPVTPAAI
jgi:hypothetical protein